MKQFVLASKSERRREILEMLGVRHEVFVTDADESLDGGLPPGVMAAEIARRKAAAALAALGGERVVVAADTIVWLPGGNTFGKRNNTLENCKTADGVAFGKPRDIAEAECFLRTLSGRTHEVYSGVAIAGMGRAATFYERTAVTFRELGDGEIARYAASGVLDKAGAYGIQDKGCLFVERIEGDFYNVVGLPVSRLNRELLTLYGFGLIGGGEN